jgi:hypothetical protein
MSQVVSEEAVIRLLVENGTYHQRRVFGDGRYGRSGDEKE